MAKKSTKTATPALVGRFAKIDKDWCVAFSAGTPIALGTIVTVMTADKREKQVRTNSEGVVLFDVKNDPKSPDKFEKLVKDSILKRKNDNNYCF